MIMKLLSSFILPFDHFLHLIPFRYSNFHRMVPMRYRNQIPKLSFSRPGFLLHDHVRVCDRVLHSRGAYVCVLDDHVSRDDHVYVLYDHAYVLYDDHDHHVYVLYDDHDYDDHDLPYTQL